MNENIVFNSDLFHNSYILEILPIFDKVLI